MITVLVIHSNLVLIVLKTLTAFGVRTTTIPHAKKLEIFANSPLTHAHVNKISIANLVEKMDLKNVSGVKILNPASVVKATTLAVELQLAVETFVSKMPKHAKIVKRLEDVNGAIPQNLVLMHL